MRIYKGNHSYRFFNRSKTKFDSCAFTVNFDTELICLNKRYTRVLQYLKLKSTDNTTVDNLISINHKWIPYLKVMCLGVSPKVVIRKIISDHYRGVKEERSVDSKKTLTISSGRRGKLVNR